MRRTLLLLCCLLLGFQLRDGLAAGTGTWFTPAGNGTFSAAAQSMCQPSGGEPVPERWAPNHRRKLATHPTPDGGTALFAVDDEGHAFAVETAGWRCPEVAWSADSTLFFVTYSDGGAVGTYDVTAYRFAAGAIEKIDLARAARREFQRHYPRCLTPEAPNIAGVAWSADSARLLVAAQVLPHSNCDDMGTFALYVVAVSSGAIIDRIPQVTAKITFGDILGPALQNADDTCFSTPGSCAVPARHRTTKGR